MIRNKSQLAEIITLCIAVEGLAKKVLQEEFDYQILFAAYNKELKDRFNDDPYPLHPSQSNRTTAELRRRSMDLSHALVELRKP